MPSLAYLQRMDSVLAARVEAKIEQERPRFAGLRRAGGIVGATLTVLVILKAAGLAHDARAFAAHPGHEAGLHRQLAYWLVGADPVSRTLAAALGSGSSQDTSAAL